MLLNRIVIWLIVGALAGNIAGRLVTFKKEGLGRWTNLGVGIGGALLGGFLFYFFNIDFGLGEIKVSVQDLIAAVAGSLLLILILKLTGKFKGKKQAD